MKRIMVVDDEKFIRMGIKRMIEQARPGEYEVLLVRNGKEAMEVMEKTPCDMVLTDVNMPVANGIELIRWLARRDPRPITVIISGYDRFSYAVEGMRNGVSDYLLKPILPEDIANLLAKYEGEHASRTKTAERNRELLTSEIGRAILDGEIAPGDVRRLCAGVREYLGREGAIFLCLRIQTAAERTRVSEWLAKQFGDRYLITPPVGKWTYVIVGETPAFLEEMSSPAFFVGRSVCKVLEDLTGECRRAKEGAKKAFLTETFLCDGEERPEKENDSFEQELTELKYRFISGSIEGFRNTFEKIWTMQRREATQGALFAEQMKQLLDFVAERAPEAAGRYRSVSERLFDPFSMNSWYEFKQELFGYVYLIMNAMNENGKGGYSRAVLDAMEYIDANFARDINLALVANTVGANYSVLSRIFAEQVGENFVHYLKRRRIEAAQEMLRTTQYPSVEIGHKVGFQSERQYAKVFKELVGITPNEYRKMHNER